MIREPGIFPDMDADEYFADPAPTPSLRQSIMGPLLDRSPFHAAFEHRRLNPYGKADAGGKAAFIGSAVHRIALGRGREISILKFPDYKSSTARERRDDAIRNKRIPVLERDYMACVDMAELVRQAIDDAVQGEPYLTELPFFWTEETAAGPIWCAGMADVWVPTLARIIDPKTTIRAAVAEAFGSEASQNGYDVQAAWYSRGFGKIFPDLAGRITFENLVVEKTEPHAVARFAPSESSCYAAETRVERAIQTWGRCLHGRSWPSYPRELQTYSTPSYYQSQVMLRDLEESQNAAY